MIRIAIYGSCVSRDTCEFINGADVISYTARQSVTSALKPYGTIGVNIDALSSNFQKSMVLSDLTGNAASTLSELASDIDVLLIDLVDERRGFWMMPDGKIVTNSIENEVSGLAEQFARSGGRLVHLGSDEHFTHWKLGFDQLLESLERADILPKTILLDLEWARAIEGSRYPRNAFYSWTGRSIRRLRRVMRSFIAVNKSGKSTRRSSDPTRAEQFNRRAKDANSKYERYRAYAKMRIPRAITKPSRQLRIGIRHRWGPQPFHYRDDDYIDVAKRIQELYLTEIRKAKE